LAAEYGAPLPEGDAGLIEAEMRDRQLTARRHALLDEFGDSVEVERIVNGPIEPPEKRPGDFIEETAARTLAGAAAKLRFMHRSAAYGDSRWEAMGAQVLQLIEKEASATPRPEAAAPASLIDSAISAVSGDPAAKALPRDRLAAAVSEALALRLLARYQDARTDAEQYGSDVSALPVAPSFAEIAERYATLMREEVLDVPPETTSAELRYLDLIAAIIADQLLPHEAPVMSDDQDLSCALQLLQWVRNQANSRDVAEGLAEWRCGTAASGKDA
jgi:hypothetical protein